LERGNVIFVKRITKVSFFLLILTQVSIAADIAYTNKEILRNGGFELGNGKVWHCLGIDVTTLAVKDGQWGAYLGVDGTHEDRYLFQKLLIPTKIASATISFDYGADEHIDVDDPSISFQVCLAKTKEFDSANLEESPPLTTIGVIHSETIASTFDWKTFTADIDPSLISEMQAAHENGEFIYLLFQQTKTHERHRFKTKLDNISFAVNGTQHVPQMGGKIAYLENNVNGNPHAINILDPNDRNTNTIWRHPDGEFKHYGNIAWSPDANRLAFVSDHNLAYHLFKANIFSIKPDGSGLHRIPQTPSQQDIGNGAYPLVTVTGTLEVESGIVDARYWANLGVHGTRAETAVEAGEGEKVPFAITDVPVLDDPNAFAQPIIMTYGSNNCIGGVEFSFPVATVGNGNVDIGTIKLFGASCMEDLVGLTPRDLSWTRDGTEIGFTMDGLKKINVESTKEFDITRIEPYGHGVYLWSNMAWSPVDNRYLYIDFTISWAVAYDLYIVEEGGESRLLVENIAHQISPVWLPDGTGFIYVGNPPGEVESKDANIFRYDLASGRTERLTYFRKEVIRDISISPDGRHIVFEMHDVIGNPKRDLWIIDRTDPVEIWKITDTGDCRSPDWSRKNVVTDTDPNNNDPSNGSDAGGGGGCFIDCSNSESI
jgi:hypothetical protein